MYAKLVLVGNLGRDPELRYTPDGTPVCNFSVACNRKWTNKDGSKGEQVTWFRITTWRRMAEVCNEYLSKGRQVLVEGRLTPDESGNPRTFKRNNGEAGASYEVTAQTVKFLGGTPVDAGAVTTQEAPRQEEQYDEIPF